MININGKLSRQEAALAILPQGDHKRSPNLIEAMNDAVGNSNKAIELFIKREGEREKRMELKRDSEREKEKLTEKKRKE